MIHRKNSKGASQDLLLLHTKNSETEENASRQVTLRKKAWQDLESSLHLGKVEGYLVIWRVQIEGVEAYEETSWYMRWNSRAETEDANLIPILPWLAPQ